MTTMSRPFISVIFAYNNDTYSLHLIEEIKMESFDMFLIVFGILAALGPGYFIGRMFSTERMSYWRYVWRGVWVSAVAFVGLALLFYFGVQVTVDK